MLLGVTSTEVAPPLADRFAQLRAVQHGPKNEEESVRALLISGRDIRVDSRCHAIVSDRVCGPMGWQALARQLDAPELQIAGHTSEMTCQQVEVVEMQARCP